MHYTTNGKPATDLTKVGIVFAKEPPTEMIGGFSAGEGKFVIPPGAPAHEVRSKWTFNRDVKLVQLTPHMHLRGKSLKWVVTYPDGREQTILNVPKFDFNWQFNYELAEPLKIPAIMQARYAHEAR